MGFDELNMNFLQVELINFNIDPRNIKDVPLSSDALSSNKALKSTSVRGFSFALMLESLRSRRSIPKMVVDRHEARSINPQMKAVLGLNWR